MSDDDADSAAGEGQELGITKSKQYDTGEWYAEVVRLRPHSGSSGRTPTRTRECLGIGDKLTETRPAERTGFIAGMAEGET